MIGCDIERVLLQLGAFLFCAKKTLYSRFALVRRTSNQGYCVFFEEVFDYKEIFAINATYGEDRSLEWG